MRFVYRSFFTRDLSKNLHTFLHYYFCHPWGGYKIDFENFICGFHCGENNFAKKYGGHLFFGGRFEKKILEDVSFSRTLTSGSKNHKKTLYCPTKTLKKIKKCRLFRGKLLKCDFMTPIYA